MLKLLAAGRNARLAATWPRLLRCSAVVRTPILQLSRSVTSVARPKPPLTMYLKFFQDHHRKVAASNPEKTSSEICRLLAAKWQSIDPMERKAYSNDYLAARKNYETELAEWEKKLSLEDKLELAEKKAEEKYLKQKQKRRRAIRKAHKLTGKPKKPVAAFLQFFVQKREEIKSSSPNLNAQELAKKASEIYNALPPAEKKVYLKMGERDKERYVNEMKNYTPPPSPPMPKKVEYVLGETGVRKVVPRKTSGRKKATKKSTKAKVAVKKSKPKTAKTTKTAKTATPAKTAKKSRAKS